MKVERTFRLLMLTLSGFWLGIVLHELYYNVPARDVALSLLVAVVTFRALIETHREIESPND